MNTERMSFEEAARELGISEEELEQLVAAGEIASVKEGDTLFFKKVVVQKFKKQREATTPTILLADEEINLLEDEGEEEKKGAPATEPVAGIHKDKEGRIELSLDDLDDIDLMAAGEGAPETKDLGTSPKKAAEPLEISDDDTLLNLDGVLEEDSEGTTPVPAAVDSDSTLVDTDLLDLGSLGEESDPFASDTVEETGTADLTEAGTLLRGGGARVMQMKRKKSHAPWTIVLALSAIVLILPLGIATNLLFTQAPQGAEKRAIPTEDSYGWIRDVNVLDPVVESLADLFRKG